jgi:hypothetical protein
MTNREEQTSTSLASWTGVILAWALVSIPLLWGVWQTIKKAAVLFQ